MNERLGETGFGRDGISGVLDAARAARVRVSKPDAHPGSVPDGKDVLADLRARASGGRGVQTR